MKSEHINYGYKIKISDICWTPLLNELTKAFSDK